MKKIIGLLLSLALVMVIAACNNDEEGDDKGSEKDSDKVTLWYWNRGLDESVLDKVKDEFPDVDFVAQKLPPGGDYKTKLSSLLASKKTDDAPDLVLMNVWISEFLPHEDKFANLFDYGGEEFIKDFPEWKANQAITGDGEKLIAVPVDTAPTGFFYREDIFKDLGIASSPEELTEKISTWDGYVDVLKTLKDKGNVYAEASLQNAFASSLNKLDRRFFDEENNFIGDEAHIKEVWDRVIDLDKQGLVLGNVADQSQEWNAAINNNELVGYDGPVWAKDIIMDAAEATSGKWKVARSPFSDGNDGGSFLAVLDSSKNKEVSAEIAKFINSAENQIESYKNLSLFPSAIEALDSDEINHEEEFFGGQNTTEIFSEAAKNVQSAYKGPQESIALTAFSDELELVKTKGKDPEKAWEDALKQIERDLAL